MGHSYTSNAQVNPGDELLIAQKMARKVSFCDNICMVFERKDGVCVASTCRMGASIIIFSTKKEDELLFQSHHYRNGRAP